MGRSRRLARITTSDSEDEDEVVNNSQHESQEKSQSLQSSKKKKVVSEEEEEDPEEDPEEEEEKEEPPLEDAKPIGNSIKVSGKGKNRRTHYQAFEYDGNQFELEDSVLLTPEEQGQKPYVAIIKEITQTKDGSMMVLGQWFYRPEEAERRGGGSWEARDTRELFYSFHRDEVPAESVMHKCQAHFVPIHKQFPERSVHPGFIVQKVYDTVERKLWKLTDKDYEDNKQHEIDLLVQKTRQRLGELPDLVESEDVVIDPEPQLKDRRGMKRRDVPHIDVSREDEGTNRFDQNPTAETPGSVRGEGSEYYKILVNFKALTGESIRDKWLERLLQSIQCVFDSNETAPDDNDKGEPTSTDKKESTDNNSDATNVGQLKNVKDGQTGRWPDDAVPAVVALEKAAHDGFDYAKYNQKMRQMAFNLRSNTRLAKRLINGELEALVILHMSPTELKDGLTAEETATKEPEESERMQMTDARCKRCQEKKVGLTDIIQAGGRGDRYQLECIACGNTWYAFRDEVSTLTIDGPTVAENVGTAPWATAKFENVEKKLVSPREAEKPSPDIFRKTNAPTPGLDSQKSFKKPKGEEPNPAAPVLESQKSFKKPKPDEPAPSAPVLDSQKSFMKPKTGDSPSSS